MKIIDFDKCETAEALKELKARNGIPSGIAAAVREIIENVRSNGDKALWEYTRKFDGVNEDIPLKVTAEELKTACSTVDGTFMAALEVAIGNIRRFHEGLKQKDYNLLTDNGSRLSTLLLPLQRVAVYVPGGSAAYPSTVLMGVIPALVAGVKEIFLLTPPGSSGGINPYTAAAACRLGIRDIYRVGGAQAIAAAAYGTETIPRADKIIGPGNIYVAAAKREVFGQADIDMIAGPSEIAVIADGSANAAWVAADMLSQAEHDSRARVLLVTDSEQLAKAVCTEIRKQLAGLPRKEVISGALEENCYIFITGSRQKTADIVNTFAPEHLEIITENPSEILKLIRNAGAVFLGPYSPEPVGDYVAGPSHILPTGGTAVFSSGVSVESFIKRINIIDYRREDLELYGPYAARLAAAEGLDAHANAVKVRFL